MEELRYQRIRYAVLDPDDEGNRVARVTLDRPETRNAQDKRMTYELDDAFGRAVLDPDVKVIVLDAEGPHFSSGHDLRDDESMREFRPVHPVGRVDREGVEGHMAFEEELYLGMCWRWRNLPKPTIAAAQGKTIAGGLMLLWVCDLIVAAEDASFCDPTVAMGVNGVEYFAHPWEVGPRRAKEWLFTGGWIDSRQAEAWGMVNHVVQVDELHAFTLDLARRVATRPAFALKAAKESVNQTLDAQGQWNAFRAAFSWQQLGHAHNRLRFGLPVDPSGLSPRAAPRTPPGD
jgi:enoyl-CoA hydratase